MEVTVKKIILASVILSSAIHANAETVTTTDGRQIELNSDGTYEIVESSVAKAIALVEEKPYFEHFAGEYGQNSMRFMPIFRNKTGKTVVGFKFRTEFRSAFDDVVFSFEGESSEKFSDGAISTNATFWYFEDNQFIGDQPYDNLKIFEGAGTGKIITKITAVVFEDGSVQKAIP
jgi:Protein of unknown function (DUF3157)